MKTAALLLIAVMSCSAAQIAGAAARVAPGAAPSQSIGTRPMRIALGTFADLEKRFDGKLSGLGGANDPIDLLGTTRGLYLEGYGAVFTAELSLVTTPGINPFRPTISEKLKEQVHERKVARLPLLKQAMREMMKTAAMTLIQVPEGQQSCSRCGWITQVGRHDGPARAHRHEGRPEVRAGRRHPDGRTISGCRHPSRPSIRSRIVRAALPAAGRDPDRARQDRSRGPGARARTAAGARRQARQDPGGYGAAGAARRAGGAFRSARRPAGCGRGAAAFGARNRRPLAPLPAAVPRLPGGAGRFRADDRDGRPAGFRDHRGRAGLLRAGDPDRAGAGAGNPRRHREALRRGRADAAPARAWTRRPAPISSTCATWRARRPSSAW